MNNILPVSVIIVSYNTLDLTRRALLALLSSDYSPAEVIVVDNASNDGSAQMIEREFSQVKLIRNEANLGFARANNVAFRQVGECSYVWLLNSDTEVGKSALGQMYQYLESNSAVAVAEPQLIYPSGAWQSVGGFFPTFSNVFFHLFPIINLLPNRLLSRMRLIGLYPQRIPSLGKELDYVTGAALFLRRSCLQKTGFLDDDYFMYFEEADLCWRLKQSGWKIMAIDTDPVVHIYGASFKTKYDAKRLKLFLNSLCLFVRKNYFGWRRSIILAEVAIFGPISLLLKRLKLI